MQNIVYCNYAAQVLLKITRDPVALKEWVNAYRYNAIGLEVWHATPSAVTGLTLANVPETDAYLGFGADGATSAFVKTNDGLILEKAYYTANTGGGADRRLWKETARKGRNGPPEILNEQTYLHRSSTEN